MYASHLLIPGCFGLTSPRLVLRVAKYRSSSHNGMPRGSYMLPNPVHYHVRGRHFTQNYTTALLRKPTYVTYPEQQQLHQQLLQNKHYFNHITINVTNTTTSIPLNINIPFDVVKQFIEPFTKIININTTPRSQSSTTSSNDQTIIPQNQTYDMEHFIQIHSMNNKVKSSSDCDYTGTDTETEVEVATETETETEEEVKIMRKQRDNLMNDIDNNISILNLDTSFSDVEVAEVIEDETISGKILDFARKINHCQFSAVQIWQDDTATQTPTSAPKPKPNPTTTPTSAPKPKSNPESNNNLLIESFNSNTTNDSEYQTADESSDSIDKARIGYGDNFSSDTILKSIFEISKDYDNIPGVQQNQQQQQPTEIEETTIEENEADSYLKENGKYIWSDHNCATAVKLISKKIYKYLIRSCIETIETLEFPEIRCYHDAEQLFDEIISIFDQFADCFPSEKDISLLKKSIMANIAKNIERHFLIIPLTDKHEIDKIIEEHKFTTLKKFISLLVYILFDKIENPEFQCTHYELPDLSDFDCPEMKSIKFHSTPETETFYNLSEETSDVSQISEISETSETIETIEANEIIKTNETNEMNNTIELIDFENDIKKKESESITTFLKQKSEKTGSLQYWFMVNDKVINPKRSSSLFFNNKPVFVSPQRLRRSSAPARFMSDVASKILSPIPEEPRRQRIFHKITTLPDDSEADEQPKTTTDTSRDSSKCKTSSSMEIEADAEVNTQIEANKNYYEICYNFNVSDNYETYSVRTSDDSSVNASVAAIRKSPVKKQNGRILFMKEVTFIPKENIRTKYNDATIVNSVTFIPKSSSPDDLTSNTYVSGNSFQIDDNNDDNNDNSNNSDNFENSENNDDWMGYELAKF